MKIKKVNKNYYKISAQPLCSVLLDEYLMKKANKILCKYFYEMRTLLENNREHLINEEWSLAYPNGVQKSFYGTNLKPSSKERLVYGFDTRKVSDLYDIGNANIFDEEVIKIIAEIMENCDTTQD